jgi:predicted glycosyltransferase
MPKRDREKLKKRAKVYGIKTLPFHPRLEEVIKAADLVISMGGYNTICEILTQQTPALIIPRETPRKEQLIRAQRLKEQGLIDYLGWHDITPQRLREKIFSILDRKEYYADRMAHFRLTGLDTMLERLKQFRHGQEKPEKAVVPIAQL